MSTAIVTGASSGVGREIAKKLDAAGHDVVLVARSRSALEELAATMKRPTIVVADLSAEQGASLVKQAVDEVDILVNNAGFGDFGAFASSDLANAIGMIQVNCSALTELTALYLPGMIRRGEGHILNIASTAAFLPGPGMAVYYATKAYVLSFSEAVAEETRLSGVKVTAFCPGPFDSGFQKTAKMESSRLVKSRRLPTSLEMATEALGAMDRSDVVFVPGLLNKLGAASGRFTPRPVMRRISHALNRHA